MNNRQTVFFLPVDPMDKNHKDLDTIDLEASRLAQHMHKAWRKHQKYEELDRHQSCSEERIEVLSNTIERYHSSRNLPSYCTPKVFRMETREVMYEKVYMLLRPPSKISLKHEWTREFVSKVARQQEGKLCNNRKSSQSSQPNPNPDHDRTEKRVVCRDISHEKKHPVLKRSEHVSFREKAVKHNRKVKHVVYRVLLAAKKTQEG